MTANLHETDSIDGPHAWLRLVISLILSIVGGISLWSAVVVLPAIEAEFVIDRGDASIPYLAPEPGAKKFVEVGQKIKKGQTIMIVEAMKTMNHVPSTNDGIVKKILVNDGQPVEFGQPLIVLK